MIREEFAQLRRDHRTGAMLVLDEPRVRVASTLQRYLTGPLPA